MHNKQVKLFLYLRHQMHSTIRMSGIVILTLFLLSCGPTSPPVKLVDKNMLMAQALVQKNFVRVHELQQQIRLTENTQNIIKLYEISTTESMMIVEREINYNRQFFPQMNFIHKSIVNQIMSWVYLKHIYRKEISPPVRILQREALYLAPSHIDFSKCLTARVDCANDSRAKLLTFMTNEEIAKVLKKMAIKDPCANLSSSVKGEVIANRCLRASKGNLQIELLPKPSFSNDEWLQALTYE